MKKTTTRTTRKFNDKQQMIEEIIEVWEEEYDNSITYPYPYPWYPDWYGSPNTTGDPMPEPPYTTCEGTGTEMHDSYTQVVEEAFWEKD